MEVKALHARENGLGHLLRVGGAENEDDVLGRLLQRLEQRIERRRRQHVNLVNDVDLVAAAHGREAHTADDLLTNIVDPGARRRVKLVDVRMLTCGDELTVLARAVRELPCAALAHEGLGEDACHGRLARATWATKEVGMAGPALKDGMLQRGDDMLLANDVLERLGTILPVQRLHGTSDSRCFDSPCVRRTSSIAVEPARARVGRALGRR